MHKITHGIVTPILNIIIIKMVDKCVFERDKSCEIAVDVVVLAV